MLTVAVFESAVPSFAVYVNVSTPVKSAGAVYDTVVPLLTSVPPWADVAARFVIESVSSSTSVSLLRTASAGIVPSSATVSASSTATGASFTAVTVMLTVATFESAVPSFAVYVNVSTPLKSDGAV